MLKKLFEDFFDDVDIESLNVVETIDDLGVYDMSLYISLETYIDLGYTMFLETRLKEMKYAMNKFMYTIENSPVIDRYNIEFIDDYDNHYKKYDEFETSVRLNCKKNGKEYTIGTDNEAKHVSFDIKVDFKFDIKKPKAESCYKNYYDTMLRLYYVISDYSLSIQSYEVSIDNYSLDIYRFKTPVLSAFKAIYVMIYHDQIKGGHQELEPEDIKMINNKSLPHFELKDMPEIQKKPRGKFKVMDIIYETSDGKITAKKTDNILGIVIDVYDVDRLVVLSLKSLSLTKPDVGDLEHPYEIKQMYDSMIDEISDDVAFSFSDGRYNQKLIYGNLNKILLNNEEAALKNFDGNWKRGPIMNEADDKNFNMPVFVSLMRFKTLATKPGQWRLPCVDELKMMHKHYKKIENICRDNGIYRDFGTYSLAATNTWTTGNYNVWHIQTIAHDMEQTTMTITATLNSTPVIDIKIKS